MTSIRVTLAAVAAAILLPVVAGAGTFGGDAKGKHPETDCYAVFQTSGSPSGGLLNCSDGDPSCDLDGLPDGQCTIGLNVCARQEGFPGCTPVDVTKLTGKLGAKNLTKVPGVLPTAPVTAPTCGAGGQVILKLKAKGKKPSKTVPVNVTAITGATGKLKKDKSQLKVRCSPAGAALCPVNAAGGPSSIRFRIGPTGQDLDIGWTGNSMNSLNVNGGVFNLCLKGCGADGKDCVGDDAATNAANGDTFGAPLPLLASGTATCTVNAYDVAKGKISGGMATLVASGDLAAGGIKGQVNLTSIVHLTDRTAICPKCSGADLGQPGSCDNTGPHAGQPCTTEGVVTVSGVKYTLSSTCIPDPGGEIARLTIPLALTTSQTTMTNQKATCGGAQSNQCGTNNAEGSCTNTTCAAPTNGSIAQMCCDGKPSKPCQPADIVRDGVTTLPAEVAGAVNGFPKEHTPTLASTFCIGATGSNLVNGIAGLPGPGSDLLAVDACWLKDPVADVTKCANK